MSTDNETEYRFSWPCDELDFLANACDGLLDIEKELRNAPQNHRKSMSRGYVVKSAVLALLDDTFGEFDTDIDLSVAVQRLKDRHSRAVLRPAIRAIGHAKWLATAIQQQFDSSWRDAAERAAGLELILAVRTVLEMITCISGSLCRESFLVLNNPQSDLIECRNGVIRLIRSNFQLSHQVCASRLIEAAAKLNIKFKVNLWEDEECFEEDGEFEDNPVSGDSQIQNGRKSMPATPSPNEIVRCRELYKNNPEAQKKDIISSLNVGSDKAQALRTLMRMEGLDQSKPRNRRPKS